MRIWRGGFKTHDDAFHAVSLSGGCSIESPNLFLQAQSHLSGNMISPRCLLYPGFQQPHRHLIVMLHADSVAFPSQGPLHGRCRFFQALSPKSRFLLSRILPGLSRKSLAGHTSVEPAANFKAREKDWDWCLFKRPQHARAELCFS